MAVHWQYGTMGACCHAALQLLDVRKSNQKTTVQEDGKQLPSSVHPGIVCQQVGWLWEAELTTALPFGTVVMWFDSMVAVALAHMIEQHDGAFVFGSLN